MLVSCNTSRAFRCQCQFCMIITCVMWSSTHARYYVVLIFLFLSWHSVCINRLICRICVIKSQSVATRQVLSYLNPSSAEDNAEKILLHFVILLIITDHRESVVVLWKNSSECPPLYFITFLIFMILSQQGLSSQACVSPVILIYLILIFRIDA